MAHVRIHNITDRPNVDLPAYAVKIGGQRIRPGKFITVDDSVLSQKHRKLHGSAIWIGQDVPKKYKATSKAALRRLQADVPAMDIAEARQYLSSLKKEDLLDLCESMSPALEFAKQPATQMLVMKLARACFSDDRVLDPQSFFWLRRWRRRGNAFIERS